MNNPDYEEKLEKDLRKILNYARGRSRELGLKLETRSFYEFPSDWTNPFFPFIEEHHETVRFLYGTPRRFNSAENESHLRHTSVDIDRIVNQLRYGLPTSNSVQLFFFVQSPRNTDRKYYFPLVELFCDDKSYVVIAQSKFAKKFLDSLNDYMKSEHKDWQKNETDQRTFLHLQSYAEESLPDVIKLARLRFLNRSTIKS